MFTVKFFRGPSNSHILIKQSAEIGIERGKSDGSTAVVTRASADAEQLWHYIGGDDPNNYTMAVIENAAGKTTEIVRP